VVPEPIENDHVQGPIGLPVSAAVEAVVAGPAGEGLDRADTAQASERGFGADPVGIVPGGDQQLGGGFWAEPWPAAHAGGELAGQPVQVSVGGLNLLGQLGDADREPAQASFHRGNRPLTSGPVAKSRLNLPGPGERLHHLPHLVRASPDGVDKSVPGSRTGLHRTAPGGMDQPH
jgi:hypothetical protein